MTRWQSQIRPRSDNRRKTTIAGVYESYKNTKRSAGRSERSEGPPCRNGFTADGGGSEDAGQRSLSWIVLTPEFEAHRPPGPLHFRCPIIHAPRPYKLLHDSACMTIDVVHIKNLNEFTSRGRVIKIYITAAIHFLPELHCEHDLIRCPWERLST